MKVKIIIDSKEQFEEALKELWAAYNKYLHSQSIKFGIENKKKIEDENKKQIK